MFHGLVSFKRDFSYSGSINKGEVFIFVLLFLFRILFGNSEKSKIKEAATPMIAAVQYQRIPVWGAGLAWDLSI